MDGQIHLNFRSYIVMDHEIWFSNFSFNGLFKYNRNTGETLFVHKFKNSQSDTVGIHHSKGVCIGDELIFMPGVSDQIITYNKVTQDENVFVIPGIRDHFFNTLCTYQKENKIWLFSSSSDHGVWIFDMQSKTIQKDCTLSRIYSEMKKQSEINAFLFENILLFSVVQTQTMYEIDLETMNINSCEIDMGGISIDKVAFDGKHYWILLSDSQDIYEWDREKNVFTHYRTVNEEWMDTMRSHPYRDIVFLDSEIILVNYRAAHVMRVNRKEKIIERAFAYPDGFQVIRELRWGVFTDWMLLDRKLWLFPEAGNMILVYDMAGHSVVGKELAISRNDIPYFDEMITQRYASGQILYEGEELYQLKNFIKKSIVRKETDVENRQIGNSIYEKVRGQMKI